MAKKNNMEVLITADSSKMTAAISNAKKALSEFESEGEKLDAVQQRFDRIEASSAPLQKKLKQLQMLMAEMNLENLTHTDVFAQLAEQAGTYSDAIGDARTAISAFANDNMKLQAMAEGFQLITGSASVLTGALGMLGVENDKVEEAMLKVQSAIALVNGVTSIANILNKDSALMLRLKSIRLAANTAAEKANSVAEKENSVATTTNTVATTTNATVTGASTVANTANTASTVANSVATTANNGVRKIWNMTVAISKALMGDFTGLVLLGAAALTTYALCTDNSTEATEKNNNAVRFSKTVVKEYSEELASTMKKNVERVKELSKEFNSLQTEASKTEWIKQNKTELDNLGVSVKDLINLDNEFKNVNSSVISSMEARAKTITALNQVHKKYLEETATKSGELVGKFMELKREWDNLKSTADKTQWLKDNQSAFNTLGLSVGDLTTAERIFVNDTAKVVKALEARAQAMAAQAAMTDAYSQYYKQKFNNANSVSGGGYYNVAKEGDKVDQKELIDLLKSLGSVDKNGGAKNDGSYKMQNGNFTLTEKGANQLNEKRQQEARERLATNNARAEEELTKKTTFLSKEFEKSGETIKSLGMDKVVNPSGKGTKADFKEDKKIDYLVSVDDGSLDTAEKKLNAWKNKLKVTPVVDKEGREKCQKEIDKWTKEKIKRQLIVEGKIDPKIIEDTEKLEKELSDLEGQKKEKELSIKVNSGEAQEELNNLNNRLEVLKEKEIEIKANGTAEELKEIQEEIKSVENRKAEINLVINAVTEHAEENIKAIDARLEALQSKEIELSVNGSTEELEAVRNEIKELTEQRNLIQLKVEADTSAISDIDKQLQEKKNKLLINYIKLGYEIEIEKGSKADLENDLKDLQKEREILMRTKADPKLIKEVDDLIKKKKEEIESEDIRLGIKPVIEDGSLNEIKKRIKEKEEEINLALNTNVSPEKMRKMQSELDQMRKEEEAKEIELGIKVNTPTISKPDTKFERGSVEDKRQSLSNAQSMVGDIQQNYRLGIVGKEEAIQQIKEVNAKLQELGLKPIYIDFDSSSLDNLEEKVKKSEENWQAFTGSISNVGGIVSGIGGAMSALGDGMDEASAKAVQFAGQALGSAASIVDTARKITFAKQAEAMASGAAEGAKIPFPANIPAILSIVATLVSVFSQIPKFEKGGIVPGTSFTNDRIICRLNSGEGVLTKRGINNLYNTVNNAEIGQPVTTNVNVGGQLKVSGTDLKAVLRNYDSKMGRIK